MSTHQNFLAQLLLEASASQESPVYEHRKTYDSHYTPYYSPYPTTSYHPPMTNVPEQYRPSTLHPSTLHPSTLHPSTQQLSLRKDEDDNAIEDSLCTFGDKIGELAWEYWLRKNDHWRWQHLPIARPMTPWLIPATTVWKIPAFPRFLELPVEIREMIYEHALRKGSHFDRPFQLTAPFAKPRRSQVSPQSVGDSSRPRRLELPALCLTSKLEYDIATRVLVRGKIVYLRADSDASAMENFLTSITSDPSIALTPIRRADVVYQSRFRNKGIYRDKWLVNDFIFFGKCSQLREVTITIPVEHWYDTPSLATPQPRRLEPEELGNKFGLALLRSCTMLQRLTLVSLPTWYLSTLQDWTVDEMFEDLAGVAGWVKGNALPTRRKGLSTKLVYTNGTKVPFLTTNDEAACDWEDLNVGCVRAFVIEPMA